MVFNDGGVNVFTKIYHLEKNKQCVVISCICFYIYRHSLKYAVET